MEWQDTWRPPWNLRVQPKIRVLWWRVLKGFLPSFGKLHRCHTSGNAFCPMCDDNESLLHSLIECDYATGFWKEAEGCFEAKLPQLHPMTWARDILDSMFISKERTAVAVSVMWAIWSSRNKYTHDDITF